jgi:hypothetical protein
MSFIFKNNIFGTSKKCFSPCHPDVVKSGGCSCMVGIDIDKIRRKQDSWLYRLFKLKKIMEKIEN